MIRPWEAMVNGGGSNVLFNREPVATAAAAPRGTDAAAARPKNPTRRPAILQTRPLVANCEAHMSHWDFSDNVNAHQPFRYTAPTARTTKHCVCTRSTHAQTQ